MLLLPIQKFTYIIKWFPYTSEGALSFFFQNLIFFFLHKFICNLPPHWMTPKENGYNSYIMK